MDGEASLSPKQNSDEPDQTAEMDYSSTVLDLTSFQLHDLDSVELPPTLTELDVTANRLSRLDPRIAQLSNLKKLSLRQNLIDDAAIEPISCWEVLCDLEVIPSSHVNLIRLTASFVAEKVTILNSTY